MSRQPSSWRQVFDLPLSGFAPVVIAAVLAATGCGSRRRPEWMIAPPLDPAAVARAVMEAADKNGDGALDAAELPALPALAGAMAVLDANGDERLAKAEIETWLERVKREGVAGAEAFLVVTHRGQPVADALVKLVPEACMGGRIEPGEGRTDSTGFVSVNIPTRRTPGVRCGLYRVEITGNGSDGSPLPAKYNTATTLGLAVGGGLPEPRTPEFALE